MHVGTNLIHCGIGLFCLPFLARILLTLNVFRADMTQLCKISLRYLLYIYSSNTARQRNVTSRHEKGKCY